MRGDYPSRATCQSRGSGPSPRAWGLQVQPGGVERPGRAIPTCVGTTRDLAGLSGEPLGPSPRAWGLRKGGGDSAAEGRAIPTCVGTTRGWSDEGRACSGHPHVRGDYRRPLASPAPPSGPSPRAWGLPGNQIQGQRGLRAIPTCVGTTRTGRTCWPIVTGHPHVRGDYGLQPLLEAQPLRAIPTCVGTTAWGPGRRKGKAGHPHVRGDYGRFRGCRPKPYGPSPRAWGLHLTRTAKIPAYPPLCIFSGEVPGRGFQVPPRRGKG